MHRRDSLLWLTIPAAVAAALPASAQTFATEAEALQAAFGAGASFQREEKTLIAPDRQKLEESTGLHFREATYSFVVAERNGKAAGYAVVMNEIGKSEPITFLVAMSPAGKVTDVIVMVFRESRGAEVREQRFARQFRGKTVADPLRVNQDILNYTGATLSSSAVARGVKRALVLFEHFYPAAERGRSPQAGVRVLGASPVATACRAGLGLYRQTRYLMGTLCEVRLWAEARAQAARALAAAFGELHRLDAVFSNYGADSELARVNREAAAAPVAVSGELWELTRYARSAWRQSAGAFDITSGPLLKAWGFWQREPRIPSWVELAEARARVGAGKLELDARARTIRFRQDGMELDFGGLAKGYAVQRAARALRREGVAAALVNLGGSSLYAVGTPPAEPGNWVVAVSDPRQPQRAALLFELGDGWAVSTSGTCEQSFSAEGRRFSHLLDPRSGEPLDGLRSATVIARSGRRSEVLTKLLLLGARARRARDWVLLEAGEGAGLEVRQRLRGVAELTPLGWPLGRH